MATYILRISPTQGLQIGSDEYPPTLIRVRRSNLNLAGLEISCRTCGSHDLPFVTDTGEIICAGATCQRTVGSITVDLETRY